MYKKHIKKFASGALISLVLAIALSACPVKATGQVTRIGGSNRYETAAQVATSNWTTTDNVVLVSGEGYADSVSASALAKKLDAPILLTTPDTLNSYAKDVIEQLKPKNIYVIGGAASISQNIRDNLKILNYNLIELGGANRYETNVAVAEQLIELGVSASNVLVVGGDGFSDALSVAPVAAVKGQILLLASNDEDSIQPVIDFVKNNNSIVTVVGTKYVINDAIYNALGADIRVDGGADRFATNLNILSKFKDDLKNDKLYVASANPDAPDNLYADALVASSLAGKYSAPLVLIDKDDRYTADNAIDYISDISSQNTELYVIGGTGVISDSIVNKINRTIFKPTSQ
ncbi:cell wall-binding repeat-containing protein [Clostridium kluyveri]|uniref:cell wall-binding repeat-containing protein n=1 Tax=Clostridium kluyveri TaxID=1534 RepID=UPI0022454BF8|nr:cell wall-binding repeat-containing protein [Clostridium kluyveri]UZQ49123.1 cell wall-binding repeat-containing protein [Clostridium kluyveri]